VQNAAAAAAVIDPGLHGRNKPVRAEVQAAIPTTGYACLAKASKRAGSAAEKVQQLWMGILVLQSQS
jgi:hypothetical protein